MFPYLARNIPVKGTPLYFCYVAVTLLTLGPNSDDYPSPSSFH